MLTVSHERRVHTARSELPTRGTLASFKSRCFRDYAWAPVYRPNGDVCLPSCRACNPGISSIAKNSYPRAVCVCRFPPPLLKRCGREVSPRGEAPQGYRRARAPELCAADLRGGTGNPTRGVHSGTRESRTCGVSRYSGSGTSDVEVFVR